MTGRITEKHLLPGILLIFFLTACNPGIVYTDSVRMQKETWNFNNITSFSPEITDTLSVHDIFITIRTGSDYPYRNLWLFVSTTSPSGKTLIDTLEYMLADNKGKRYGRGTGDIRETDLDFRKGVFFPEKGTYIFRIRHGMRTENLKGIYDIGLRIEKRGVKSK